MSFSSQLKQTALVYRKSVIDTFEPVVSWVLLGVVPCMTDTNTWGKQYIDGSGKVETIDCIMYCESTDITTLDRVVISGVMYEVMNPDNPNSLSHHLEILLKRLPPETPMVIPGAVAGATQTLAEDEWSYNHFYVLEHQNFEYSEITINSVTGSVDDELTADADYLKGQNQDGEWGIFLSDATSDKLTTEAQDIVIDYDYNSNEP